MALLEVEDLTFELAGRTILDGISLSIERGESPVRKMIGKDFPGTVKVLAAAGFQTIELCSPTNFAHPKDMRIPASEPSQNTEALN